MAREKGEFVDYEIDQNYENYFNNWYHEMDLMCMAPVKYLSFQTFFLITMGVSGVVLNWVPEVHGRKKTLIATTFIN